MSSPTPPAATPAAVETLQPPTNSATRRLTLESTELPSYGRSWYAAAWQVEISDDGNYVVHTYGWPEPANILLHNLEEGSTTVVSSAPDGSPGDGLSISPTISADGSVIAFASTASNLADDPYEGCDERQSPFEKWCYSIYAYDVATGQLERIDNGNRPVLSGDGRYLAYFRGDQSSIETVIYDRATRAASSPLEQNAIVMDMSYDGGSLAYISAGDCPTQSRADCPTNVFVYDRNTQQSEHISQPPDGTEAEGVSGVYVAAPSGLLSSGGDVAISADGRYVVFGSTANLTQAALPTCPGHTLNFMETYEGDCPQFYLYDRQTGQMEIASLSNDGQPSNGNSFGNGDVSNDGRFVVFTSTASNLWTDSPPPCTQHVDRPCVQVFLRDRQQATTYLIGEGWGSVAPNQAGSVIASSGLLAASWLEADVHETAIDEDIWDVLITDLQALTQNN